MEQENLVVEQLKAIRSELVTLRADMGARIDHLTERVDANTEVVSGLGERMSSVEQAIVGYTAQITMFSRSLTVQMEARSRIEDKVDELMRRLERLEQAGQ